MTHSDGLRLRDLRTRERRLGWLGSQPILVRWNAREGGEVEISTRTVPLPDLDKKGFEEMSRTRALDLWRHMGQVPGDEG